MEKEKLYEYFRSLITSSTKSPKYMSISTVKTANLLNVPVEEIDQSLQDFVSDGRLKLSKLDSPPFHDIYLLP